MWEGTLTLQEIREWYTDWYKILFLKTHDVFYIRLRIFLQLE